jgi:hypothetical protein
MAEVYCPRCFELVEGKLVFCENCGQFIHENAPADSRVWDSRPPEIPDVIEAETNAPIVITLPDEYIPSQPADPAPTDETGSEEGT